MHGKLSIAAPSIEEVIISRRLRVCNSGAADCALYPDTRIIPRHEPFCLRICRITTQGRISLVETPSKLAPASSILMSYVQKENPSNTISMLFGEPWGFSEETPHPPRVPDQRSPEHSHTGHGPYPIAYCAIAA